METIYIVMSDEDIPIVDYEGSYLPIKKGFIRNSVGAYQLTLVLSDVDPTKEYFIAGGVNDTIDRQVTRVTGSLERLEENRVRISLSIASRVSGIITFCKMAEDGKPDNEFPEFKYDSGETNLLFTGQIVGWLQDEE